MKNESEKEQFAAALERRGDYKVKQLCREVERTLASVLGGDLGEGSLGRLCIMSVDPAPDASRLMVTLMAPARAPDEPDESEAMIERLRNLAGFLRAEVAAVVQRKKVPELAFCIITESAPEQMEGEGEP